MSGITIYPKDLKNYELPVWSLIILKALYMKEKPLIKAIIERMGIANFKLFVTGLEEASYIKIMDSVEDADCIDSIAIRQATEVLFKEETDSADAVLTYLNYKITGGNTNSKKGFSLKSSANKKFIKARLAEGYTVEELKLVIDSKFREWDKTDFAMYLRPETLFNPTKFSSYLSKAYGDKEKSSSSNFTLSTED